MVAQTRRIFRCVLLTPRNKLLDCRMSSLILPAHDGQVGILRNHIPMLCKLGLGIMQAKNIVSGVAEGTTEVFFLIEGGFCRVSENFVTVLAYEATTFDGMKTEDIDKTIGHAERLLAGDSYARQSRSHDVKKASLLLRLAQMADLSKK